ncbi:MAG TPA: bi-domain-containing oxidoreductase [Pyrinomonadaceae bacterium]|jgi:predicted dehydrogenase/threonine dehydrogenase-like Zn-dependent dehydrogenase|nr:bi-domain-containing oxidoreductase [Pyrinomonadaceae bacterium]
MKQLLQQLKNGEGVVADVPAPSARRGRVVVRTAASLVSAGTERAIVELGRKSLLGKVRERPEAVRKVLGKVRDEGLASAVAAVRDKLGEMSALGYSASGVVVEVGEDVTEFGVGDRVACAGAGYASHAEVLSVPKNLCVRLPEGADFEAGAFGTVGAIALQGVRLAEPTLGESVVVIGLGLIGQLTVQLLKANGCRVFGIDLDPARVELALSLGADDGAASGEGVRRAVEAWTRGRGADAVLITAATDSNEPVELAGEVSRLKGRVVAVGGVGLGVPRDVYYVRELTLKVSMSYGPGRYDPEYEERGHDYPLPYVRWTEGRNIEAFLDLAAAGRVRVAPLVTHRFPVEEGAHAYQLIAGETKEPYLGVLLTYDTGRELERRVERRDAGAFARRGEREVRVGLIGAGGYARAVLLPGFKAAGAHFQTVATASGVSARSAGEKFGFASLASGADEVIDDPEVNLVVIATRHDTHAELARRALERGKHVFVEKPLALSDAELDGVLEAAAQSSGSLMVGFNRRFSPSARAARDFFADRREPLSILYRVNAGRIPRGHWAHDPREGGGRIRSEVCHFVDLCQFWAGSPPARVHAEAVETEDLQSVGEDSVFITLRFADGSNACVAYLAEGDRALAKERVEIFGGGRSFVIDDFRAATRYSGGREEKLKLRGADKGQAEEVRAVCAVVLGREPAPIPLAELDATTRATFRILDSLRTGRPARLDER